MNLQDLIQKQLTDQIIGSIAKNVGIQDSDKAQAAATGVIQSILAGVTKNASSPEGAQALDAALERDHDGSILEDVMGMVVNQSAGSSNNGLGKALDGSGILRHVLGSKQDQVVSGLSKSLNLDGNSVAKMATMLAPLVMGALGKTKKQANLGASDLGGLLSSVMGAGGMLGSNKQVAGTDLSFLEQMIDSDGDGDIKDDLMGHGMKILGSFFKKR